MPVIPAIQAPLPAKKCLGCPEKDSHLPCQIAECPARPTVAAAAEPVRRAYTIVWRNGRATKSVVESATWVSEVMAIIRSTPDFGSRAIYAQSDLGNLVCISDIAAILPQ